jgi:acetyl esterase/lipase
LLHNKSNKMKRYQALKLIILMLLLTESQKLSAQIILNTPGVQSKLYVNDSLHHQPLVVGFGGSEGGNAWASNYWKKTRDEFLAKGYAFLAIGYFKAPGTPDTLNKIAIDKVHDGILEAVKNPHINKNKIAIIGGSRGADLALLIASYYKDIKCVVAIVPSNVAFPGNTNHFSTSAWTYNGKELPFVPVSDAAVPSLMKGDLRATFAIMVKDTIAANKAAILVERINGPVLFMSATRDEIVPSAPMSDEMMARLKAHGFKYYSRHIAIEGSHAAPLKHFDSVFEFLDKHFIDERGRDK